MAKVIYTLPDKNQNIPIPSLKERNGRPILVSMAPCWQKHVDHEGEVVGTALMGIFFTMIVAMLAEAFRYLREGLEASALLVIARNKIDVNTKEVQPALECDAEDERCLRIVEEVVTPLKPKRCHWRHTVNALLYGIQCCLQLQCLLGVLSLNAPLIVAVLMGVFLGRLFFYWRPRQKPFSRTVPPYPVSRFGNK